MCMYLVISNVWAFYTLSWPLAVGVVMEILMLLLVTFGGSVMRHQYALTVHTVGLLTVLGLIDCIEWPGCLRQ